MYIKNAATVGHPGSFLDIHIRIRGTVYNLSVLGHIETCTLKISQAKDMCVYIFCFQQYSFM